MIHSALIKKQREKSVRQHSERPCLHVPVFETEYSDNSQSPEGTDTRRGCEVVDFTIAEASIV